ncbi:hypothetical protein BUALT_Bualt05G0098000 [Buddleja alternifolia]|uniref:Uncharacterized protein n=1 Tax=Buddleja alternifolia TaxID=168488 RepID=A0AAV6XPX6_9LAMI|nr:hypothetical protein BUALT_Bualt05G0098000 [Buddleja alternifolia]
MVSSFSMHSCNLAVYATSSLVSMSVMISSSSTDSSSDSSSDSPIPTFPSRIASSKLLDCGSAGYIMELLVMGNEVAYLVSQDFDYEGSAIWGFHIMDIFIWNNVFRNGVLCGVTWFLPISLSLSHPSTSSLQIPRLVFHGMCCFLLLSSHNVKLYKPHVNVKSDTEPFFIPGMPVRVEIAKNQLPGSFMASADLDGIRDQMQEAEMSSHGVVVNTFPELKGGCAEEYNKVINKKVRCIRSVSLCNREELDKFERGNKALIDGKKCVE